MFHADRWDYVFYFKRGNTSVVQQRDFVVNFAGDRVASWSGGQDLPSNLELLAEIDGDKRGKKAFVAAEAAAASGAVAASGAALRLRRRQRPAQRLHSPWIRTPKPLSAGQISATDAVQAPSGKITPSVQGRYADAANGGGASKAARRLQGRLQFQFTRPAPPAVPSEQQDNPVGPAGSQSNSGPTYNAPLTSAPVTSGTGS